MSVVAQPCQRWVRLIPLVFVTFPLASAGGMAEDLGLTSAMSGFVGAAVLPARVILLARWCTKPGRGRTNAFGDPRQPGDHRLTLRGFRFPHRGGFVARDVRHRGVAQSLGLKLSLQYPLWSAGVYGFVFRFSFPLLIIAAIGLGGFLGTHLAGWLEGATGSPAASFLMPAATMASPALLLLGRKTRERQA
jgi:hypothetical protein